MKPFGLSSFLLGLFALITIAASCGKDGGSVDPQGGDNYYNWPTVYGNGHYPSGHGNCVSANGRYDLIRVIRSMPLGHGFYEGYKCSKKKVLKIFDRTKCTALRRSSSGPQGLIEHELGVVAREQLVDALVGIISNAKAYYAFSGQYHRIALENEFWDFDLCQPLVAQPLYIQKTQ